MSNLNNAPDNESHEHVLLTHGDGEQELIPIPVEHAGARESKPLQLSADDVNLIAEVVIARLALLEKERR